MIIIKHRVNNLKTLKKTQSKYGVEIDLRSENNKIFLSHDAFTKGVLLEDWLKNFNHKIIVLNVKEEGLEEKILGLLKKKKLIISFFMISHFPVY